MLLGGGIATCGVVIILEVDNFMQPISIMAVIIALSCAVILHLIFYLTVFHCKLVMHASFKSRVEHMVIYQFIAGVQRPDN